MDSPHPHLGPRTMASSLELTPLSTSPVAQIASLTEPRYPNTPACHRVFGTVELAEAILGELSLEDLLVARCACKTLYNITKTSAIAVQSSVWLSTTVWWAWIDRQNHAAAQKAARQSTEEGKELDADEDVTTEDDGNADNEYDEEPDNIIVAPPFNECLSFIVPAAKGLPGYVLEMVGWKDPDDWISIPHIKFEYATKFEYAKGPWDDDTKINVDPASSDELWRRLPVSNNLGGVDVELKFQHTNAVYLYTVLTTEVKHFPVKATLGDLYVWLSDEVKIHRPLAEL